VAVRAVVPISAPSASVDLTFDLTVVRSDRAVAGITALGAGEPFPPDLLGSLVDTVVERVAGRTAGAG
jgi:hypothetical protein